MFEGPGTTMTEVNTQFSLMTALFVARNVLYFEFPAFFIILAKFRTKKKIRRFFFRETAKTVTTRFSEREQRNPAIVT